MNTTSNSIMSTKNELKKKYSIRNDLLGFGDVDMESPIQLEDFKNPYE